MWAHTQPHTMLDKWTHQIWLHRSLLLCSWINIAASQLYIRLQLNDRFSIPMADTLPEVRNLNSFSPPTHFIIHSFVSAKFVLSRSYHFSLSPQSSIKQLLSPTTFKYSKQCTVTIDIFCPLKLSAHPVVVFLIDQRSIWNDISSHLFLNVNNLTWFTSLTYRFPDFVASS